MSPLKAILATYRASSNDWSENAENALNNQQPPVYKIDLLDLENNRNDYQTVPR